MSEYKKFASMYSASGYSQYSERMVQVLPAMLERFDVHPQNLLDVACGEGAFAVAFASQDISITGVDLSSEMIEAARARAKKEKLEIDFQVADMRELPFESQFDTATCWYDSLNYLLTNQDLTQAFSSIARALKPNGLFVFDVNTIYGLAYAYWQLSPYRIDTDDTLVLHQFTDYDHDTNIVTMKITGFQKDRDIWNRFDEVHRERGYTLAEIRKSLESAGLTELGCWGHPSMAMPPRRESARLWFAARKS